MIHFERIEPCHFELLKIEFIIPKAQSIRLHSINIQKNIQTITEATHMEKTRTLPEKNQALPSILAKLSIHFVVVVVLIGN